MAELELHTIRSRLTTGLIAKVQRGELALTLPVGFVRDAGGVVLKDPDYVAEMMGEDLELLEAIVWNDDNLTYGSIISVYTGPDESITALTDGGIEALTDMLRDARLTKDSWHQFLDDFAHDPELVARITA